MQGKVLIIDDIATNRIVLNVKLSAAGYHVVQAASAFDGLTAMRRERPDLVLASARLSGMAPDVFLKRAGSGTGPVRPPVIMLMNGYNPADRLRLMKAGATDVMSHPPEVAALLSRFRAVMRNLASSDDARLSDEVSRSLGFSEAPGTFAAPANVTLVPARSHKAAGWRTALAGAPDIRLSEAAPDTALARAAAAATPPDVLVIEVSEADREAGLRLIADLRAHPATRHSGLIALLDAPAETSYCGALDRGADDVLPHGFCAEELGLRITRLAAQKAVSDQRRAQVHAGLRAAVTDPLTGLPNRRFAELHLSRSLRASHRTGRNCAVMVLDIDHFKQVNDVFGHAAGDAVLCALSERLSRHLRATDLLARIGGEEFLIVLPETGTDAARSMAERLCSEVALRGFALPGTRKPIRVTLSIGVALASDLPADLPEDETAAQLVELADSALYASKRQGRNKVTMTPRTAA